MCTLFRSTFSPPTCTALFSSSPKIRQCTDYATACHSAHLLQSLGKLAPHDLISRMRKRHHSSRVSSSVTLAGAREEACMHTMMPCMSGSSPGKKAESRASLLPSTGVVSAGQISCREAQAL